VSVAFLVSARSAPQPRPNIVLLLTDDMTLDELAYMPNVNRLIGSRGVTFTHDYVPYSLCCPARATMVGGRLRRQWYPYPRNKTYLSRR
jgi:arylsulfatase A-like enzyme